MPKSNPPKNSTPKPATPSRGSVAFKAFAMGRSWAQIARDLSAFLVARGLPAIQKELCWQYANGVRRPLLDRAAAIEAWTGGAVPAAAWAELLPNGDVSAGHATVAVTSRASSHDGQGQG